jgi:hypothetical protein
MQQLHIKCLGSNSSQYLMFLIDLDGLVATATPSSLPLGRDLDALLVLLLPSPLPLPLLQEETTIVAIERTG